MEKKIYWPKLVFGETLHSGIGQGYFQSTPIQLCLMTAQIANGGFEIKPRIIFDKEKNNLKEYLKFKNENPNQPLPQDLLVSNFDLKPFLKIKKILKLLKMQCILLQMNQEELHRSRLEDKRFTFAGKTGSSQIKKFTEAQREAEVKQEEFRL